MAPANGVLGNCPATANSLASGDSCSPACQPQLSLNGRTTCSGSTLTGASSAVQCAQRERRNCTRPLHN
jgi:hypothetical protein